MKTQLTKNQKYKATVKLSFLESIANNDVVKQKLVGAGFTDVTVTGSGTDRIATGIWPKDNMTVDIPSQIKKIELL